MVQVLTTGDENAGQQMRLPVPGRASPLAVTPVDGSALGSLIPPLANVFYCAVNTTTPLAEQTGSIAAPFETVNQAVAAAVSGDTIICAPGDYGVGIVVTLKDLTFIGLGEQGALGQVTFGGITVTDASLNFQNMAVAFEGISDTAGVDLGFFNCQLGGEFTAGGISKSLRARLCSFTGAVDGADSVLATSCNVSDLTNTADAVLTSCTVGGAITCSGSLVVRAATGAAAVALTAAAITVDSESLRALVFAGATFVGPVSGYSGQVLSWGAAAAATGEFLNPGNRATNPTSVAGEDFTRIFSGRHGVLCLLHGYSSGAMTITVRVNTADTALAITCNNNEQENAATFIPITATNDTFSVGITGAAGAQALCSFVFV